MLPLLFHGDHVAGGEGAVQEEGAVSGGAEVDPFNPLATRVQKIKIHNLTLNRLLIFKFVKKMAYLSARYSERRGLMG